MAKLTDTVISNLKPAAPGRRYEVLDNRVSGLIVRVTSSGHRSFMLYARFPGSSSPTRRAIGDAGKIKLEQARDVARHWHALIARGVDPKAEQERERREAQAKRRDTFGAVAEEFIRVHLPGKRRARRDEQEIRRLLLPAWGDLPITGIHRRDVVRLIEDIAASGRKRTAHIAFGHARLIFSWAVRRDLYGLENSPCSLVRPADHAGRKRERQRVLTDGEIAALWRACEELREQDPPDPHGALVQLVMLTGARRTEAGEARWSEFDLERKLLWCIPPERFKSETEHHVPLSPAAVALLESLPRGSGFVFTTTGGERPVGDYSGAKARLDALMGAEPWQLHDVRRTVRTRLSKLTTTEVAELVIGHAKRGLSRVYDQHRYEDEKRAALDAWARSLAAIVSPPPPGKGKVTELAAERRRRA